MADYGGNGMPKIVVIGGGSHTVFYTANDVVDANLLQDAIDQAIEVAGISEQNKFASALSISPNPASEKAMLKFNLSANAKVLVQIYSLQGKAVKQISPGNLSVGENEIEIKTDDLASGTYLVKISSGNKSNYINLAIAR